MKKNRPYRAKIKENKARKSFLRKVHSRYKKKNRNKNLNNVTQIIRKELRTKNTVKNQLSKYNHIKAPSIFSLAHNTEETLNFIGSIETCFKRKRKVFIDLNHVEIISSDAIVVMLSILVQFKTHNIDFNGNFPKNQKARNDLKNSGFFKYLYKNFEDQDSYTFEYEICTHANKKANSELSEQIIKKASKFIWGEERRCTGVQRVFIELMQNTNNHASILKQGEKHWWASINHCDDEKKVCFSFIDFGVGVFESLANKKEDNKFYNAINKMRKVFSFSSNAELLKLLLNGDVHKTVTGKYYRGKGLPGIFEACKNNKISNLIIISNDAKADYSNNLYETINSKLSGTFVYWELNTENINLKA